MIKNILNFFRKDKIANLPWDYDFLVNLEKSEYPRYLSKLFKIRTGEKLPLLKEWCFKSGEWSYKIDKKKLKTFNQKIQYIKLYGITDLMRDCTDKVKVRDFVRDYIGDKYLKPVLQICNSFEEINFDKLPDSFVIKCNNGCKRHYIIKNKGEYLKNKRLVDITRRNITGWIEQDYSLWNGFELNYRGIEPKILIEPLMRNDIDLLGSEIQVYVFNSMPEFIIKLHNENQITIYDKNLNITEDLFGFREEKIKCSADELIKQAFDLSKELAKDFNFVRVDWLIYNNRLYFGELTFTPFSGFFKFKNRENNLKLGKMINLKGIKNE